MTAVCNDYHADEIFARQVWGLAEKGDVLIGITTSGKSKNILRALEEAKRKGVESIAILGRDGGFTKGAATIDLIVPGTVTARIQEGAKGFVPRALRNGGRKTAQIVIKNNLVRCQLST
jgi:D-sedoheptulose 7-phosphate isomerase